MSIDYMKYEVHSKGPWHVDVCFPNIFIRHAWAEWPIGFVEGMVIGGDVRMANARLFADAPVLLDRCKELETENAALMKRLKFEPSEAETLSNQLEGLSESYASLKLENEELKKRLECPKVKWVGLSAVVRDIEIGRVVQMEPWNLYSAYIDGNMVEANKETQTEAQTALEHRWLELWNVMHGAENERP